MKDSTLTKRHSVRHRLEAAIRSGEFAVGEQLPSEQELSERFGVSYMTARQAVSELVAADVLERRARKGTFVRHQLRDRLNKTVVNLITSAYEGPTQKGFLSLGMQMADRQGWSANIIRLTSGQQDPAVRVIRDGELAIVLLDDVRPASSLSLTMRGAKGRAVLFHCDRSYLGIPSIKNDAGAYLGAGVERLVRAGHRRIGVVAQFISDEAASWDKDVHEIVGSLRGAVDLIAVQTPLFYSPTPQAHEAVAAHLREHPDTTGLVTMGDELAVGAMSACRAVGRAIPDSISLVNLGDSPLMAFFNPPATCVDYGLEAQFKIAVDFLQAALAGETPEELLRITPTHIVDRETVGPPPSPETSPLEGRPQRSREADLLNAGR